MEAPHYFWLRRRALDPRACGRPSDDNFPAKMRHAVPSPAMATHRAFRHVSHEEHAWPRIPPRKLKFSTRSTVGAAWRTICRRECQIAQYHAAATDWVFEFVAKNAWRHIGAIPPGSNGLFAITACPQEHLPELNLWSSRGQA